MALPIPPATQATGDVDVGTNPPTTPLFVSQQVDATNVTRTVGGTTTSFGQLDPEPPVEAGVSDTVQGRTTLFDPGTGVAEGTTAFFGSQDDDANVGTETEQANVNAEQQADRIEPQPNVLSRFSNYTYSASVYLLNPQQFEVYQQQKKKTINGYHLLFQSGGAAPNVQGPQASTQRTAQTNVNGAITGGETVATEISPDGRNPFFADDFYIDSITLENRLFGRATMAAHSVATLKFTVLEPTNITLIDRLYLAVQNSAPRDATGNINYAAAVYLMVIRFYGYDSAGNIQQVGAADETTGLTDPNAVVEKFIPFKIKQINWQISNKLVTYEFDCAPIGQMIAGGTRRGTIPADVEVSGVTVETMLQGDVIYGTAQASPNTPGNTTTATARENRAANGSITSGQPANTLPAPAKADAAPTPRQVIRQGLITAMNEIQQQYVAEGKVLYPDVYEIEFANGAESIAAATVVKPGRKVNKSATATPNATQNTQFSSPDKQYTDVTTRNYAITAGMQLLQAIELIIRNSNYITDQAAFVRNETTGKIEPNPKSNTKGVKWFNILMSVTQLQYDELRNDYAYRVKFTVVPYTLVDFNSFYYPQTKFRGVHKRYPWWFTGLNTEVLDYQATFNKLYNVTVTAGNLDGNALQEIRRRFTSSGREIAFLQVQARSSESDQGADGGANELGASAAEYLYNPSDNANARVRILGDPAWIQQGSLTGKVDSGSIGYLPFDPDGTINFDVNDVMFEVVWQRPEDYDLGTGLADPYSRTSKTFGTRDPLQSVIYRAHTVTSEFRRGRFETLLAGTLYQYPIPESASTSSATNTAQQTTNGETTQLNPRQDSTNTSDALLQSSVLANNGTGPAVFTPTTRPQIGQGTGEFGINLTAGASAILPSSPVLPASSNGGIGNFPASLVPARGGTLTQSGEEVAGFELDLTGAVGAGSAAGIDIVSGARPTTGRLRPEDLEDQIFISLNNPQQLNKDM